jgi:hypothetical protein
MNPGCTELTRIRLGAQWRAVFFVSSRTAPFAAWYAGDGVVGGLECLRGDLHAEEDAGLRHRDRVLVALQADVLDRAEVTDAGVVEQDVEPAVRLQRALDHRSPVVLRRDVVVLERRVVTELAQVLDHELALGVLDIGDHHRRAFVRESVSRGLADATGATGHDRDPALQSAHDILPVNVLRHHRPHLESALTDHMPEGHSVLFATVGGPTRRGRALGRRWCA